MGRKYLFGSILFLVLFLGCKSDTKETAKSKSTDKKEEISSVENLPDNQAGEVVKKAIDYTGGWKEWKEKRNLSYTKIIKFYDSLGTKEREVRQLHQYQLQPSLKMHISWEEEGDQFEIKNNGEQAWKFKNGEEMKSEEEQNSAWNSSFGSQYVMGIPFKLTDPGVILEYQGIDTLANNVLAHKIKTTYQKGAGSSAGKHTWWYYFDKDSYKPVANFLDYGDGYSYTQYDEFTEVEGIKLNQQRTSYQTNKNMDLLYKTTVYINENIRFNEDFTEGLFEAKHK